MKYLSLLVVLFWVGFAQSQIHPLNNATFWDDENDLPISIVNDSTLLYGKKLKYYHFEPLDIDRSELRSLSPLKVHDTTYLVDEPGGIVVRYWDKAFTRIDNSFSHKNQYGSIDFVHNNKIFLLGGYGLFTDKSILTRYDFAANEWFLEQTTGDVPKCITADLFQIIGNELFFINKGCRDTNNDQKFNFEDRVYKLNLNNLKFKYLGKLKKDLDAKIYSVAHLDNGQVLAFQRFSKYMIDLKKNKVHIIGDNFPEELPHNCKLLEYDKGIYKFITKNNGSQNLKYVEINEASILDNIKQTEPLYVTPSYTIKKLLFFIGLTLILVLLAYFTYYLYNRYNKVLIRTSSENISFRNKKIDELSPKAQELLLYLAKANSSMELADILHHLNIQASSYETLKKKRKKLLDEIVEKLQKRIGDKAHDIFIIKRSSADKRHKVIRLNPKLIHIKK